MKDNLQTSVTARPDGDGVIVEVRNGTATHTYRVIRGVVTYCTSMPRVEETLAHEHVPQRHVIEYSDHGGTAIVDVGMRANAVVFSTRAGMYIVHLDNPEVVIDMHTGDRT